MGDFCNRLYIDSRWRTPDSLSSTDFTINLVQGLECVSDTVLHVRSACFPISWWTSAAGRDRLALRVTLRGTRRDLFVPIPLGHYNGFDFAEAMEAALNGVWSRDSNAPTWTAAYISAQNRIVVQWGEQAEPARSFQFFSEPELAALTDWAGPPFNKAAPGLLDDVLRMTGASGGLNVNAATWVSGLYDASAGIHQVFLHSSLGRSLANGPRPGMDRDVIAVFNVSGASYGDVLGYESMGHTYDFSPAYHETAKDPHFRLTDYRGRTVDLAGGELSCEILLYPHPN